MQIAVEGIGIQNLAVSVKDKAASEKGRLKKKKADLQGSRPERKNYQEKVLQKSVGFP